MLVREPRELVVCLQGPASATGFEPSLAVDFFALRDAGGAASR